MTEQRASHKDSGVEVASAVARWLRVDLHTHTHFDAGRNWGKKAKKARERGSADGVSQAREWLQQCAAANLDIVAVTDHNTLDGYDQVMAVYPDWAAATGSELCILPGLEVSVSGCHFLVVADPASREWLGRLLGQLFGRTEPIRPDGSPQESNASVMELAACIEDAGRSGHNVLALPAHIDSTKGLASELSKSLRERGFAQRAWSGFQVRRQDGTFPQSKKLLRNWASGMLFGRMPDELDSREQRLLDEYVQRDQWPLFDASDPAGLKDLGSVFTWMKMSTVGLEGIRQALLDPYSRLRRYHEGPPSDPEVWIERLRIEGLAAGRSTLFDHGSLDIRLSPALNTVIGGRGSGKSTVVELLRWVLDRHRPEDYVDSDPSVRKRIDRRLQQRDAKGAGILDAGTAVTAIVRSDAQCYEVTRTIHTLEAKPAGGKGSLDIRRVIAPRIVSQRQITAIAADPRALRNEIDQAIEDQDRASWTRQRDAVQAKVEELQRERRDLTKRLQARTQVETDLFTTRAKIGALEDAAHSDVMASYRDLQEQKRWLDDQRDQLTQATTRFPQAHDVLSGWLESPPAGPLSDMLGKLLASLDAERAVLRTHIGEAQESLTKMQKAITDVTGEELARIAIPIEDAYSELVDRLRQNAVEVGQLDGLHAKAAALEGRRKELDTLPGLLATLSETIDQTFEELDVLYRERQKLREAVADRLRSSDADIRVDVAGFADRESLEENRDGWWGGTGLRRDDWSMIVDGVMDPGSTTTCPERWRRAVAALRDDNRALATRDRAGAVRALLEESPSGYLEGAVAALEPARLDEMERFVPEDLVTAQFKDRDGVFRAIEGASLGQQNTAVLSLLLSVGTDPLILDQPEDDLDNRYIYDVVVELLRDTKTERQIIVATHNANIPVNGDAESILALDPFPDQIGHLQGTLEQPAVKEAVSNIMEGSQAAFRFRQQRYGF